MIEDEISGLIAGGLQPPSGARDVEMYVGVIQTWDNQTGTNTVLCNGTLMPNLRALSSGIGLLYSPGETVVVMRKQTQYFILGRVSAPGAGAGSGIKSDTSVAVQTFGTSGTWGDLPGTPNDPQVQSYIGASRTALILYSARIGVSVGDTTFGADIYDPFCQAVISFEVSGASSIPPNTFVGQSAVFECQFWNTGPSQNIVPKATVSGFIVLDGSRGLNSGLNIFTMKYLTFQTASFEVPNLIVIPL